MRRSVSLACAVALAGMVAACGSSSEDPASSSTQGPTGDPPPPPPTACTPTGVQVYGSNQELYVTVNAPPDSDSAGNPTNATTTNIYFTVMVPTGCPAGTTFPVVLNAPGWGMTRFHNAASDNTLNPNAEMFVGLMGLIPALPWYGYVVISFDERGMGDSVPKNGGGLARVIDPALETKDAMAVIDWAYDHAQEYSIQTEPTTGIAKDIKVGTIGISYGAGFQPTLAALDPRVDAIIPAGSWHDLAYSLMPGDAVKVNWDGTLCLAGNTTMHVSPLVDSICNAIQQNSPSDVSVRSLTDVLGVTDVPSSRHEQVGHDDLVNFFYGHGMNYFHDQEQADLPWLSLTDGTPLLPASMVSKLRPVPALFLQGNRDVLFNLTEGYWNWNYFNQAGGDVRLLSNEGGHINPLLGQAGIVSATPACGATDAVDASLAWLDHYLKGKDSSVFDAIPAHVCISVVDTNKEATASPVGVVLDDFPVGSQSGDGAAQNTYSSSQAINVSADASQTVFVPMVSIADSGYVLAGAPTMASITVAPGAGATAGRNANAFVGVGIRRNGQIILVDDQVTGFTEGTFTTNHSDSNMAVNDLPIPGEDPSRILLPAVGEQLQNGDQVGLLFYASHPQYLPTGADASVYNNPYSVTVSDVQFPIFKPGSFAGSTLSK
jgi:hypothetical protein